MSESSLQGRCIAIPESRELDVFAGLLTRRGARVIRCPLVSILDAPDPAPVLAWLDEFCAGRCTDLILMTGEGLERLLSCIGRHMPALRPLFIDELARVRKFARGPKPAKRLRELGLHAEVIVSPATTAGVIAALTAAGDLGGRRVGVQHYGDQPNPPLTDFLRAAGAQVHEVAPYVYADAVADREVLALVAQLDGGAVDAIAFTSQSQVERLFKVSAAAGQLDALRSGLARTRVAAVGPVTAESLRQHGVRVDLTPADTYFLKPLTQMLVDMLRPGT
ncbi:MAG TPA: uroporphyrinogen-III synthase [Stenotrophobium sp.]|jgi:uroporphyrinogen-III synthase|nr:uroporphyrinogen-III synthase [Stenotrophobium sp.]